MKLVLLIIFTILINISNTFSQKCGCNDPLAENYDSTANINDGSCKYKSASITPKFLSNLSDKIKETSGLIFYQNSFITHNDDTFNELYIIDTLDYKETILKFNNIKNTEWEEISQDKDFIYLGDFGNNYKGNRTDLHILKIEKKSLFSEYPIVDTIKYKYSLQTDFSGSSSNNTDFDCEAFVVTKDSIYLFTKEWISQITSIYALPKNKGEYIAEYRNSLNVDGLITGSTLLENERIIVLTGYSKYLQPFIVLLYDYPIDNFFGGNKRKIEISAAFNQIEGIASTNPLTYYITNEYLNKSLIEVKQKIQKLDLTEFLSNYLFSQKTSIENYEEDILKIFPNPTDSNLKIEISEKLIGKKYKIVNIFGEIKISGYLNKSNEVISLKELTKGQYYLIINDTNIIKKIVKE